MFNKLTISAAIIGALLLGACEAASETATAAATSADTSLDLAAIQAKFPSINPDSVKPSPVAGWFEVDSGQQILYVSGNGNYALSGDLIDLNTRVNLTDVRRNTVRKNLLSEFTDKEVITFTPKKVKHTVTVFTDIDCTYCRKLHQEMNELNDLGIEVRYMFFPRSGPNKPSWEKAKTVWCSDNRQEALTQAKSGTFLEPQQCDNDVIAAHYEAGKKIGLRGTPAIVTDSGELIAGYLPAQTLLARLNQSAAKPTQ